jgi:hypothetical protein
MDCFNLESADNNCSIVTDFDTSIYKKITKLPETLVVSYLPIAAT